MKTLLCISFLICQVVLVKAFSQNAYIPLGSDSIAVVNTLNNTIVTRIKNSKGYSYGIAANPSHNSVYLNDNNSAYVTVVNTISNKVSRYISLAPGRGGYSIAVNPSGTKFYVPNTGTYEDSMYIFDAETFSRIAKISLHSYPGRVGQVIVNNDGSKVYIPSLDRNFNATIVVINGLTNKLETIIKVPNADQFQYLAISIDNKVLYASNTQDKVYVINTVTNKVTGTINVSSYPIYLQISNDGSKLYVADASGFISIINTSNNKVSANKIFGFQLISGLAISSDDKKLFVANNTLQNNEGKMSTVNTVNRNILNETIVSKSSATAIALNYPSATFSNDELNISTSLPSKVTNSGTVSVFPNPAKSFVKISFFGIDPSTLFISNVAGVVLIQKELTNREKEMGYIYMDVSELSTGYFNVRFNTTNNIVSTMFFKD